MKLIFISNDSTVVRQMSLAGVDRIMVDLELLGKQERQGHLDTVISRHAISDVNTIRSVLNDCGKGELMVRINPLNSESSLEIDEVIERGAQRIMLPMFTHPDQVALCIEHIRGRVPLTLLLETASALARLPRILQLQGFDDIHIGLNDLHLDMGLDFIFELLGSALLDHVAHLIRERCVPFGIGGVSCLGTGIIPAELILASHLSLGSQRVILSRSFIKSIKPHSSPKREVSKLRAYIARTDLDLPSLRSLLINRVDSIVHQNRLTASFG